MLSPWCKEKSPRNKWFSKDVQVRYEYIHALSSMGLVLASTFTSHWWNSSLTYVLLLLNLTGWERSHGLPALSRVWQHVKLSDVSLKARPRYSLVVDEDVKKPNKPNQTSTKSMHYLAHVYSCRRTLTSRGPSRSTLWCTTRAWTQCWYRRWRDSTSESWLFNLYYTGRLISELCFFYYKLLR